MDQTNTVSYSRDQHFFHVKIEKKNHTFLKEGFLFLQKTRKSNLSQVDSVRKETKSKQNKNLLNKTKPKKPQSKPKQKRWTTKQKKNSLLGLSRCIFCPFRTGVTNSKFLKNRKCMFGLLFWNLGSSQWYFRTVCIIHLSIMVGGICPCLPYTKALTLLHKKSITSVIIFFLIVIYNDFPLLQLTQSNTFLSVTICKPTGHTHLLPSCQWSYYTHDGAEMRCTGFL